MKAVIHLLFFLLLLAPAAAAAELPAETRWADPSSVQLNIEFPGEGYHATWDLYRCDCGDLMVHADLALPNEAAEGDILLVGGRAVLTRGFGKYQEQAAASLDAAALMMQLALRLLERSEPGGPSKVSAPVEVDVTDEINHIHLDTGSAEGGFRAPWSIEGGISAVGETRRRFDLRFSFSTGQPGEAGQAMMRLYGEAEFAPTPFPVPASSRIDDWNMSPRNDDDTLPEKPGTLEELRARIAGG